MSGAAECTYTLHAGDTLELVAAALQTTPAAILAVNLGITRQLLQPGLSLQLPDAVQCPRGVPLLVSDAYHVLPPLQDIICPALDSQHHQTKHHQTKHHQTKHHQTKHHQTKHMATAIGLHPLQHAEQCRPLCDRPFIAKQMPRMTLQLNTAWPTCLTAMMLAGNCRYIVHPEGHGQHWRHLHDPGIPCLPAAALGAALQPRRGL